MSSKSASPENKELKDELAVDLEEEELDYDDELSDDGSTKVRESKFKSERKDESEPIRTKRYFRIIFFTQLFSSPKDIPDKLEVSKEVQERIEKADNENRNRRNNQRKRDNERHNNASNRNNPPLPKNAPPVIRYGVPPPNMGHMPPGPPMGMPAGHIPPMPFPPASAMVKPV